MNTLVRDLSYIYKYFKVQPRLPSQYYEQLINSPYSNIRLPW